jgi:hypothetical protein
MTKANMDLSELLADQDGGHLLLGVSEAGLQLIKVGAYVGGLNDARKRDDWTAPNW